MPKPDDIVIRDAHVIFMKLSNTPNQFGKTDRTFNVVLDDEDFAEHLTDLGWPVKIKNPKNPDYEPYKYLSCKMKFHADSPKVRYDPNVVVIDGRSKTKMTAQTVGLLDNERIKKIDLVLTPYQWENTNGSGVSVYVKSMYVTLDADPLAAEYDFDDESDVPF